MKFEEDHECDYIPRLIDSEYLAWKENPDRLPILLNGARQVGKTESVRHFARQAYANLVEINFVKQPEFKGILQDGYSAEAVIKRMTLIDPRISLIFARTRILGFTREDSTRTSLGML